MADNDPSGGFDFSSLDYFNTPPIDPEAQNMGDEPVVAAEKKAVGGFDLSSLSYFQDEETPSAEAVVEKPPARIKAESPTPSAFVEEEDFPAIKVDPGVISRMSDEEAVRYLPKRMTLEPTSQEVETLHPALNTDEYYAKRKTVAIEYNSARTNEERIRILGEFTDVWMPMVLERATGKSGWKEKGLTGIATAAQWFDNITGRWVRALINTTAEDRKREIAGDGFSLRSPAAWWDEFKKEYERADGGIEGIDSDGERTMKNLYIWSRSTLPGLQNVALDSLAIGGKEFGGTGEQNLAAYEAEADNLFQFGADMVNDLGYGIGGVFAQIMPGGTDFSDYMAARKEAKAEGSIGGHEFIGFLGQMTADPAIMFKMPKIAELGGVLNTKQGAGAIDELLAKEADDVIAGLSDEAAAQELPKVLDGLRNEYGMKQVDAADVMFRHELPNYYGVEAPEILFDLKNPKFSHVVDDILDKSGSTTPSRRQSKIDTSPKEEGLELDEALAANDIAEQAAMQHFRAEEAWTEIIRESIRRQEIPRGIDVKYQGVDADTLEDVWSGAIRWEKPARIGKETAEQAFERNRMIHSLDNVRTKMMSGLIKKYPYLEPARRTLESIVMFEKAQPMATQVPVGDVAETRLFNIREGIRRGDLEETPEIAAEIEDLVSRGAEPARTKWVSMAPKGRARHGILHQAKFKLGEDAEKLRQLKATLSNQEAAAFFEKIKELGADNDTLTLALLFKELGRHDQATAGVLERVASMDRVDNLYRQAIDGDLSELPPEFKAEMQAIADEQGYLDNWNQAVNDAEELYKAKKVSRKEAWQEVRKGMSRLRKAMKNSLGDVFAREAELRALKDAEPVRSQIAELRAWRDQFSDLIENRIWHGDESFERAIGRITDFRQEQARAIDEMVMGKEGADPDKVFEGYRLKRVLPEGTPEEWSRLRDNFQFGISKVFGPNSEMTDVVMAITDQRAKSWAEWNRVPEDSVNAYYAASMQGPFPVMMDLDPSAVSRLKGNVFFSRREGDLDPLAYTKFEDGKAIIGVFKNAKGREAFTAVVEELGHIFRRDIPKQDLQVAEKWVRKQLGPDAIAKNGRWTERAEEAFSKAFTKWVKTGELPEGIKKNPGLKSLFEKAKDWLLDVYLVITGKKSPKIRAIFKGFGDSPATRRKAESLKAGTKRRKPVPEIEVSEDLAAVFERMLDPESLRGDYSPLARELDESLEALKASDPLTSAFAFLKVQAAIRDLSQAAGKGEGAADELLADLVSRDVDRVQKANRAVDRIKMQASGRHKTAPSIDTVMAPAKSTDAAIKKALEKDLVERLGLRPDEASELVDKGYRNAKKDIKASMKQPVEEVVEEVAEAPEPKRQRTRYDGLTPEEAFELYQKNVSSLEESFFKKREKIKDKRKQEILSRQFFDERMKLDDEYDLAKEVVEEVVEVEAPQRQRTKYDDRPAEEAFKDYQIDLSSLDESYKGKISRARSEKRKAELRDKLVQEKEKVHENWRGRRAPDEGPPKVEIPFELGKRPRTLEQVRSSKYVTKVDVSPVKGKRRYTMHVRSDVSVDGATHVIGPTVASIIEQFMKISPRKKDAPRIVSKKKKLTEQQRFHQEYPNLLKRMASDYVSKHPALARREARIQDLRKFNKAKSAKALEDLKSSWAFVRKNFNKLGDTGDVSLMRKSLSDVFNAAYGRNSVQRKSVGTDLNILLRGGERVELERAIRRIDEAVDEANNELAMKAASESKKGDPILQDAADVAAIKSTPASDETIQRAKDAIKWIDGQIKDRDTFVRMSLAQARKDAKRVRRVVDDEEELTELGALLAGAEEGIRVVDAKDPLTEALGALAPGGMEMGPRGRIKTKTKDVVSGPEIVVEELSKDMNQLLNDMPKTRESIMAAAEKMGYDLRTPGDMWNVILNAKKWARSYGDELSLRREIALEAFKNDETIRLYEGLPREVKGRVERLLKNRKLYGVAPDASPKIKELAKSLGMVGSEELFITLKRGRVKVADHFTEKQVEQALEVAKLLDNLLDKQLKTMQDAGVLVADDPVISAKIDMLRAEQTLSRDVAEKAKIEAEIKTLKNSLEVPFNKEEFLTRVGLASYVPHLKTSVARMTTSAITRGGMPSTKKGFFENQRTMASTLDDLNEQRRRMLGIEDLYHNADGIDRPAWAPGAPFHGMNPEDVVAAARSDSLESLFTVDGWEDAVKWSRENLSASGLSEFFEPDFNILIERYMRETNRKVAESVFAKDIDEIFPMGDEIAKLLEGMPVGLAELRAREFGYSRLSKYDSVQAMTGIPLPSKLRFYEETILDLLVKSSPEEVVSILREKGVSVDITQIEALRSAPTKFAPTPYVEYLRWINKPDWAQGKWWMGWLDGIHSVAKGMATISSIAHVGLNASGNHASIAQKLGTGVFNPANHGDAWMITMKLSPEDEKAFLKNMGVKYEDAPITIGPHTKTVKEWREAFDIEGISEAPLSRAFLEEMGAQPGGRAAPQLAGSALGAASFGALGFLGAGPIGAAALGFIGQYPGALMGDIISKGLASADVRAMEGGLLSKIPAAARKGWERVSFEEMEEFQKAINIATPKDIKNSVRYFGERAVGVTASAAIGSVFGPMGSVASAIAGLSLPSYMKMMTGLNQAIETQARITLAVGEIRNGKTIKEAALSVDDTLRNYSHLTPVEKHVLRRMFFFYTWDAGNMRFQMRNLVKNPRQSAVFTHFVNGVFKGSFNDEEIQAMPENLRWKILMTTGPSTIWAMNGLPQQAFIEMLGRWADGKPAGFLTRIRPDALAMFEFMADKQSIYYGKGWDELTNVRMLKDSNPWLKKVAGFPVKKDPNTGKWIESPGRRPIFDKDNNIVGWKKDYRAMHPERYYLMSKLPGWRLIMEQLKLQKESFTSTAMDYEDPSKRATNLQRAMSFITGNRPYSVDFDNQIKYYEWKFLEELQRQIKLQDKTFFVDIKRAVRRIPPKDGELDIPSDRIAPERIAPDR